MKCAVWNCVCDEGNQSSVSFFLFPKKKEYLDRWLKFCRRSSLSFNRDTWRVCMEHFKQEDMLELNQKTILRLGAVPCINKNEKSTTANKKENQKTYKQKNQRCNNPAINTRNTSGDHFGQEEDASINIKYEDGTDTFDHNITESSDVPLHTEVDIKCEYEDLDLGENNSFPPQSNGYTVSSEECGATDEAYVINELDYEDSCSSEIFASNENTKNCTRSKHKLSSAEESQSSKKQMLKPTTNRRQFKRLVSLLAERPDIVRGFRKCSKQHLQRFWDDTSKQLNSLGPPIKDSSTWKKVWLDYKSYIKKKVSSSKAACEGDRRLHTFNDLEETVIRICEFGASTSLAQEVPMDHCTVSEDIVTSPPETPISADKPDTSLKTSPLDDMPSDSRNSIVNSKDDNTLPLTVESKSANESISNPVNDFSSARTTRNFPEVLLPSQQPRQKYDTTTRSLLQTQLSIQQHFYKKSTELSKRNNQKLDEIARNLSTISKAHESFAKTQADMLNEMCRHNRAMEELKREQIDKIEISNHHNS